jgi:hypothetical protein
MGKARGGLEEAQATRNEASNAKGTLSNAIAKEERVQREWENQALLREEERKKKELEAEIEANKTAALLAADERKESARRWNAEQGIRLGDLQRKKDKDAGETGPGKLQNLTPMVSADGREVFIGQNSQGVNYERGGSEPIDPREYEPALTETQVAAGTKKLSTDIRDVLGLGQTLSNYTTKLAPYAIGGENPTPYGDIPGRGRFSGREGVVGDLTRLGEEFVSGEGSTPGDLYAVGREIANMKIREAAGLSQTAAEIERVRPVLEGQFASDPIRMHEAIMSIQRAYEQDLAELKSGTPMQVLKQYEQGAGKNNVFTLPRQYIEFPKGYSDANAANPTSSGFPQDKAARLAELRRKKAEGALQ